MSHFYCVLLFSITLFSSIFCYFCCIVFLCLCQSYKFFPANFFIQLYCLTLLHCFSKLLFIIFNQEVCFQISYNVLKCLLLSFILFFSVNFFAYNCSNLLFEIFFPQLLLEYIIEEYLKSMFGTCTSHSDPYMQWRKTS